MYIDLRITIQFKHKGATGVSGYIFQMYKNEYVYTIYFLNNFDNSIERIL